MDDAGGNPYVRARPSRLQAHLAGLLGANLVVGAVVLWVLPLLAALDGGAPMPPALLPWAAGTAGLVADAVLIVAFLVGILLVRRAARRIAGG